MTDVYVSALTLEDLKVFDNMNKYRITVTDEDGKTYMDFDGAAFETEAEAVAHCEEMYRLSNDSWTYSYLKPYCELTVYHGSLNVWSKKKQEFADANNLSL